jgi:rare lipoprotein A
MTSKAVAICTIAGAILATTVGAANSTPLHTSRGWHYSHSRVAGLAGHHRVVRHALVATSARRHHGRSYVASEHSEKSSLAKAAVGGGLMAGIASVYSGERTANGEYARAGGLTAAHRTLPFGTLVKVTRQGTGRSVIVRINDRGPFVRGRVIDLTPAGARALGFSGLAPVTLSVMGRG